MAGSSRDACRAGHSPPIRPSTTERPSARNTSRHVMSSDEVPVDATIAEFTRRHDDGAERHAHQPADEAHERGLGKHVARDAPARGTERTLEADLARPLAHRHRHGVDDRERAHDERDRRDAEDHRGEQAGEAGRRLHHLGGAGRLDAVEVTLELGGERVTVDAVFDHHRVLHRELLGLHAVLERPGQVEPEELLRVGERARRPPSPRRSRTCARGCRRR